MTSTPVGHVDFSMLTSELRILPIAPSWAEVERAVARLDSLHPESWSEAQKDEQVQRDIQTVQDFSQNLEENRESLALALYCAAILGKAALSGTEGERLAAGLRAISRCHRFNKLSRGERLHELQTLTHELEEQLEILAPEPPTGNTPSHWRYWWDQVVEKSQKMDDVTRWSKLEANSWTLWASRLADYMKQGVLLFRPQLADLASAMAETGPGQLFHFDLSEMTLADWSTAFIEAWTTSREERPPSSLSDFIIPTLYTLSGPMPTPMPPSPSWEEATDPDRLVEHVRCVATTCMVILIRRTKNSMFEKSPPASVAGLISVDMIQAEKIRKLTSVLQPALVISELPAKSNFPELETVYVSHDRKASLPNDAPVIFGTKDADDLLLQAESLTGIDLTKKHGTDAAADEHNNLDS